MAEIPVESCKAPGELRDRHEPGASRSRGWCGDTEGEAGVVVQHVSDGALGGSSGFGAPVYDLVRPNEELKPTARQSSLVE